LFWFEVETGVPRIIKQRRKINMQQRRRMFEKKCIFSKLLPCYERWKQYLQKQSKIQDQHIREEEKKIIDCRMKKEKDLRKIDIPERESSQKREKVS
jgi:hypothetical protein